ncbi:hypothetical protein GCM10010918_14310 [Paenibacillus radicis (ex Gao et al. 2016)]|uniref:Esterase n=2 Tax=Paenibacillus radicis (ex Gao et al. 2016) TaxID=1737354 RepID=A0A917LWJ0_9BACL|nr:hypothetical protein GCM10010918_14310 [Paenibacillus radicis (ex Gao et al. 2016)]
MRDQMKKIIGTAVIMLLLAGCGSTAAQRTMIDSSGTAKETLEAAAQTSDSSRMQHLTLESEALGKAMKVNVYLPEEYADGAGGPYPVLYALHGKNGNENSFFSSGLNIGERAAKLVNEGRIAPFIIVSPQLDNSYGVNSSEKLDKRHEYALGRYEDYLLKDLIPAIDANYNTVANREGRYIGGISMGGYAALHLALTHPDMFSKVGGHSAAVWKETPDYLAWLYQGDQPQEEVDPVMLVGKGAAKKLAIYLDHGDKEHESIADGNQALMEALDKAGVSYEYHSSPGGHNDKYWAAHMDDYLQFYGNKGEEGKK